MNPDDRAKVGRWLDHVSGQARTVERHLAARRAAAALVDHPELAQRAHAAVLAGERCGMDSERIMRAVEGLAAVLEENPDAVGLMPVALRQLPDGRLLEVRVSPGVPADR